VRRTHSKAHGKNDHRFVGISFFFDWFGFLFMFEKEKEKSVGLFGFGFILGLLSLSGGISKTFFGKAWKRLGRWHARCLLNREDYKSTVQPSPTHGVYFATLYLAPKRRAMRHCAQTPQPA